MRWKRPSAMWPEAEDINVEGLDGVTTETVRELLTVDRDMWKEEAAGIEQFYGELTRVPEELYRQLETLKKNLN